MRHTPSVAILLYILALFYKPFILHRHLNPRHAPLPSHKTSTPPSTVLSVSTPPLPPHSAPYGPLEYISNPNNKLLLFFELPSIHEAPYPFPQLFLRQTDQEPAGACDRERRRGQVTYLLAATPPASSKRRTLCERARAPPRHPGKQG